VILFVVNVWVINQNETSSKVKPNKPSLNTTIYQVSLNWSKSLLGLLITNYLFDDVSRAGF